MQREFSKVIRCSAALSLLLIGMSAPVWSRDPALTDRNGQPRSERAHWVYRIVAKWGNHVQEAYRTDPRRWAETLAPAFARASLPALRQAAEAGTFSAMNDSLLAASRPDAASGGKALGDADRDLVYVPVTPCRILDTRNAGGAIAANGVRDFDLADAVNFASQGGDTSNCNVGDKGSFAAAAINFTVVNPNMAGYITAFPNLVSRPNAATVNYAVNDIQNGFAIVRLDQSAATHEFSVYSVAQTHLVADVVGYFVKAEPSTTTVPLYYWATSTGNAPCSNICGATDGDAVATGSGMVCRRSDGSSHHYEVRFVPQDINAAYYACGAISTYRTAQCSCMKE